MAVTTDPTGDLAALIDTLAGLDPAVLGDGETLVAINRQYERLGAIRARATAAFDASGEWEASGARTAAAWLAIETHQPLPATRRQVRLGRRLRHMGLVEQAWVGGTIGEAQVGLLANARTPATADDFATDEKPLVEEAERLSFADFAQAISYWRFRCDPDGAEDDAAKQADARSLHLSQSFGDMWFGDFTLDPIRGTIVANELRAREEELFKADWAEAKERLGREPHKDELGRTPAQRRADALAVMAERSAAAPADGRRPEPLFSVLVGYETFLGMMCQLANGTMVTPGSLLPWLDRAWVERVVFDTPSRVMDVGVRRRLFEGATRRAVEVRDRRCFHDYCELPADECEIDHIEPYSSGGLTTQANGRVACWFHNRRRHRPP